MRYDLSDLREKAVWVLQNPVAARQIVGAANAWCRQHMTHRSLAMDYLDIWQAYVEYLDAADPDWMDRSWRPAKQAMFAEESSYDMITLS